MKVCITARKASPRGLLLSLESKCSLQQLTVVMRNRQKYAQWHTHTHTKDTAGHTHTLCQLEGQSVSLCVCVCDYVFLSVCQAND